MNQGLKMNSVISHTCKVLKIKPLNADTFEVELKSIENTALSYKAGQYLQLKLDVNNDGEQTALSYSIANRLDPRQPNRLQLFIHNNSAFSNKVLSRLGVIHKKSAHLDVNLPLGQAFLQTNLDLPHVLVAAGSGISKIKCLTEEILAQKPTTNVHVYWSNKSINDFYLVNEFQNWANQHPSLSFTTIIETAHAHWAGRTGLIYEVLKADFNNLSETQAYLCGSPNMVYGTIDQLKTIGLKEHNCYSDVFEYAPREQKMAI